jgi:simple sugar transport system ATP-binding protein
VTDVSPALALEQIDKRFGAVTALSGAKVVVRRGTVHALLGENGAGKTTLMRIAYGMVQPDAGVVRIDGQPVRLRSPADAIALGVGMVHQHFTLVPAMTAAENIALGNSGMFDPAVAARHVHDLTRTTGLAIEPNVRVRDLPVTAQQRLELLKVLSRAAKVVILDEPTALLAPQEADDLLRQVRQLADGGRTVVLITHKLRDALGIADDVTVLRHGSTSLVRTRGDVDEDALIQAMLGQHVPSTVRNPIERIRGSDVIDAHDVSIADRRGVLRIRNATFQVRSGEIVGCAAIEGSGHRELLEAVAGRIPVSAGTLRRPTSVGFIPDDRYRDALVMQMSLVENVALNEAGVRRGVMQWRDIAATARGIISGFDVRAQSESVRAETLSGGNQQKFVVGRELASSAMAVVASNPTRGLDVRAAQYVIDRLTRICSSGVALLIYSTDLDEVLRIADRMLVVHAGSVCETAVDADEVGRAMVGAA